MAHDISAAVHSTNSRRLAAVVTFTILAYLILVLYAIAPYDYNLSSLIRIGAANPFFNPRVLEPGTVVFNDPASGGDGYDGQFYYYAVKGFLMKEPVAPNPFRVQRILYPLVAYVLALGRPQLLPFTMLAVNIMAIAASAVFLWMMIRDLAVGPSLLLFYSLNIGFLIAVFYDVATPLCIGLVAVAAYFYSREMLWPASALLGLSLLAQENGLIAVAALAAWLMGKKNIRGALIISASLLPWALWQVLLLKRFGQLPMQMSGHHLEMPFVGMISQLASLKLPGDWRGNLRELSVYPFMLFVVMLLVVSAIELRKRPSDYTFVLLLHALVGICFNNEQIWSSTITSPGRALAGVFPFLVLCYAHGRSRGLRALLILSGILTLMGVLRIFLMQPHPFYVT
ncbi:MAG: hypothetical protein C4532_01030 [Candidatus Abyssobacteria bacterium SURF_17]|uniref:Glycosyltransferase RgtA/B/C/D-like domain-containing protein n=1 Tax=Candidatus Abyssobacteria bacterium SURF_17 TaxID=2093361 RepID=A0A419F971_9BACT|nr:MAG: hypothetical protein C4532_01030 [Candidatus Abyssubacteria bacterium SURF_17]